MARAGAPCRCPAALPGRPRVSPTRSSPRRILMMLDLTPDLVRRPKRLRLGGLLPTLPDRVTYARQGKLSHVEFLELLLQDEIDRRDSHGLTLRLEQAAFEETATFEQIVWDSPGPITPSIGNCGAGSRRTCSSSTTSACASSPPISRAISTMCSSSAIGGPPRSSRVNSPPDRFAHRPHQILLESPTLPAAPAPNPPHAQRPTTGSPPS